jgi:hypothetical protein
MIEDMKYVKTEIVKLQVRPISSFPHLRLC